MHPRHDRLACRGLTQPLGRAVKGPKTCRHDPEDLLLCGQPALRMLGGATIIMDKFIRRDARLAAVADGHHLGQPIERDLGPLVHESKAGVGHPPDEVLVLRDVLLGELLEADGGHVAQDDIATVPREDEPSRDRAAPVNAERFQDGFLRLGPIIALRLIVRPGELGLLQHRRVQHLVRVLLVRQGLHGTVAEMCVDAPLEFIHSECQAMLEDPSNGVVPPRQCLARFGGLALEFCPEADQGQYHMHAVEDHILGILLREDELAILGDEAGACQRRRSPLPSRDDRLEYRDVALLNVAPARVLFVADVLQLDDLGANLLRHLGSSPWRCCCNWCCHGAAQSANARGGGAERAARALKLARRAADVKEKRRDVSRAPPRAPPLPPAGHASGKSPRYGPPLSSVSPPRPPNNALTLPQNRPRTDPGPT